MPVETSSKRAGRQRLYQEFMESGQSMREFSIERGVAYWVLKGAIKKTEAKSGSDGFREVALPATGGAGEYVVSLKNGRELRVPTLFSEKRVRQLIDILERC